MSSTITIKINGKAFDALTGSTLIQVADQAGIYIPRFCYHKKLSIAANCRMCLVEVEGIKKPIPACSTPVMPDMQIWTRSEKARLAQRAVMEFLLINHPLDCPICDQGGQCELQDLAMQYGRDDSVFAEAKRAVPNDDLGPLIATEMTRCIHCTRCVRFGDEIAGKMELGSTDRGKETKITTYIAKQLTSELSGNMIDVCPVGALTSKPFKFKARAWELSKIPSIAPHDCLGSHVYLHIYDDKVVRVVPKENEAINETWLSDRDRYSYLGLEHPERLKQPMIKMGAGWQKTDWPTALGQAARTLQAVLRQYGPDQVGAMIAPTATIEEIYLFQRLCRSLNIPHIDHRLREIDMRDQASLPLVPKCDLSIAELEQCDAILLIGSNIQREQPLLLTRLRKVIKKGGRIFSLNYVDYDFNFEVSQKVVVSPEQLVMQVATLARHCGAPLSKAGVLVSLDPTLVTIAQYFKSSARSAILVGAMVHHHPQASHLRYWIEQLAFMSQSAEMHLTEGSNTSGAWLAGAIPHRGAGGVPLAAEKIGLSAQEMMMQPRKAYLLFNIDPESDYANSHQAQTAIAHADCVIGISAFESPSLLKHADVLLPIASFGENAGTFINVEGKWQSFNSAVPLIEQVAFGWQILQSLAKRLQIIDMNYADIASVREALQSSLSHHEQATAQEQKHQLREEPALLPMLSNSQHEQANIIRITQWPLYSSDPLVRRAKALQASGGCEATGVYMHPVLANKLNVTAKQLVQLQQDTAISEKMPIILHEGLPENCVWTPAARQETANLGVAFTEIKIIAGV